MEKGPKLPLPCFFRGFQIPDGNELVWDFSLFQLCFQKKVLKNFLYLKYFFCIFFGRSQGTFLEKKILKIRYTGHLAFFCVITLFYMYFGR